MTREHAIIVACGREGGAERRRSERAGRSRPAPVADESSPHGGDRRGAINWPNAQAVGPNGNALADGQRVYV